MLYLSIWMLLPLFLYTSCTDAKRTGDTNDQNMKMKACFGTIASFVWDYEVPQFHIVEWYFEKTQIAWAPKDPLSQESLRINDNYKSRFYLLLEKNKFGFNLTNVTVNDEGDYKCILNLQSTSIPVELNWRLIITGPHCHRSRRELDTGEQHCHCIVEEGGQSPKSGEEEQPPASDDSPGTTNHVAVAVPVVISVIVVIAAIVAFVVIRKKRKSLGENQNVRLEAENGEVSEDLMENKEA